MTLAARLYKISGTFLIILACGMLHCASGQTDEISEENTETGVQARDAGADEGCIQGDCANGVGKYRYANGDVYSGEFENGQRHGQGSFIYANGDRFEGKYVNGLRDGRGIYRFRNGDIYEGMFTQGQMEGVGVYSFSKGGALSGEFEQRGSAGEGIYRDDDNRGRPCDIRERDLWCEPADESDMGDGQVRRVSIPRSDLSS